MLNGISIVCFFSSYLVALALDVSRLFFRMPVRLFVLLGFASVGVFTQTVYLVHRGQAGLATGAPLSSWYDWALIAAWILAVFYLGLAASRPQTVVGVFFLPPILGLIGLAVSLPKAAFPRSSALQAWGMTHGVMLLLGVVTVSLGFAAGLMFLVHSYRLKHKLGAAVGWKLPSLEWLQSVNRQALVFSSFFVLLGLLAGVILNLVSHAGEARLVPWNDPVVISSSLMFIWLVVALIFELVYKPAQQGQKVAYLTIANFIFLAIVLGLLASGASSHGGAKSTPTAEVQP